MGQVRSEGDPCLMPTMELGDFQVGGCSMPKFQFGFPLEMMLQLSQLCHFEASLSHQNMCKSPECITPAAELWDAQAVTVL